jgi:O-antigen/teichoic acid export membrane protein
MNAAGGIQHHLRRLGGNALVYGIGSVLPRFIAVLLLPVFTAYLTPAEYGILAMLGVLSMIVQPIFALGITAAMGPSYFETEGPERRAQTVWTAAGILAVSALLLIVAGWFLPQRLGRFVLLPAEHADLVELTLIGCALTILATPFMQWLQFEEQSRIFVGITVTSAAMVSLTSVVLVAWFHWGAKGLVAAQLVGGGFSLAAFVGLALKRTRPQFNRLIGGQLLGLGVRMVPSIGLLFVLMHANKHLLKWLAGLEQLGIYSVGFNLGTASSVVVSAISTSWYPFFMSFMQKREEAEALFGRIFTYYVFGVGYLTLLFFIFAKPVVIGLTQPRYWEAHSVIGLISLAYFFMGAFNLFLPGMYFAREVSMVTGIQTVAALVSIPLNYFLIVHFDILGAALGVAAGHLVMAALAHAWNCHRAASYPNVRYEWSRVALFCAGACGIALATMNRGNAGFGPELLKSILLLAAATVLTALCLNQSERRALLSRLKLGAAVG